MFVHENGQKSTSIVVDNNIENEDQLEKFILIKAC
jgi:hypothetical protein